MLFILIKFFKKFSVYFLILVSTLSIGLSYNFIDSYPSKTFYLIYFRIWELLLGCILAYSESKFKKKLNDNKINFIFTLLGLILIIYSIIFFNDQTKHPSLPTIIPVFGVCLVIWFSIKNNFLYKMLSNKLIVFIGLISYSLYLWHYPIFAFDEILQFSKNNLIKKILLFLLIIILSILSYFFIEKPSRNKKNNFKYILIFIIFGYLVLLSLSKNIINNEGYKERFHYF